MYASYTNLRPQLPPCILPLFSLPQVQVQRVQRAERGAQRILLPFRPHRHTERRPVPAGAQHRHCGVCGAVRIHGVCVTLRLVSL